MYSVTSQTEKKTKKTVHGVCVCVCVCMCVCDVRGCNIEQLDSILSTAGGCLVL